MTTSELKSYAWRSLLAAVLVGLSVAAVSAPPSPPPSKEIPQPANVDRDTGKSKDATDKAPFAVYNQTEPVVKNDAAQQHAQDPSEKRAQDAVAFSAEVQAASAAIIVLLTIGLVVYTHKGWGVAKTAADAATSAANTAKEAFESSSSDTKAMINTAAEQARAMEVFAAAATQQTRWAELSAEAMNSQYGMMIKHGEIMLAHVDVALLAATTAQESVATTRRQLEAYERPWITASVNVIGVTLRSDGAISLILTPVIRNVGKSLAKDLDFRLELVRLPTTADLEALPGRIADIQRAKPLDSGFAIFPNSTADNIPGVYDLPPTPNDPDPLPHQWVESFACIVVVFYRFTNSEVEHATRFACAMRVALSSENLAAHVRFGTNSFNLTKDDVEIYPQTHMTRAT